MLDNERRVPPLFSLLGKKLKWECETEHEITFTTIRDKICKNILLGHPDQERYFMVIVETSTVGTAVILVQDQDDQREVIGFTVNILKPCEIRYTITELEILSVLLAIRLWMNLFLGHKTIVLTDHQAVVHFQLIKY